MGRRKESILYWKNKSTPKKAEKNEEEGVPTARAAGYWGVSKVGQAVDSLELGRVT